MDRMHGKEGEWERGGEPLPYIPLFSLTPHPSSPEDMALQIRWLVDNRQGTGGGWRQSWHVGR